MLYKITIEQMSFTVVAVVVIQLCQEMMPVAEAQTMMLSMMSWSGVENNKNGSFQDTYIHLVCILTMVAKIKKCTLNRLTSRVQ